LGVGATCTVIYTATKSCPSYNVYATISDAAGTTNGATYAVPPTSPNCIPAAPVQ
jgi:hypothetical protein